MKTILLINPLSSAKYLSDQLKQASVYTIGLYTMNINSAYYNNSASYFDKQIYLNSNDINLILKHLHGISVDYVLNCYESSATLSEQLISQLTPSYNTHIADAYVKGNKYQQQILLKENNLPSIKQKLVNCNEISADLFKDISYPVFAKPANGTGSIGAFSAQSTEELLYKIKNNLTQCAVENITQYIIQELLDGIEIVVDSFSVNGKHYISNVYKYTKVWAKNSFIYRSAENITDVGLIQNVVEFAIKCLKACLVENGFSHMEIFLLADGSFRLIELNPRISGGAGCLNKLTRYLGGRAQDQLLVKHLFNEKITDLSMPVSMFGKVVFLYTHETLDFTDYKTFKENIYLQDSAIDFTKKESISVLDLRQLVILASNSKEQIDIEYNQLIRKDII